MKIWSEEKMKLKLIRVIALGMLNGDAAKYVDIVLNLARIKKVNPL